MTSDGRTEVARLRAALHEIATDTGRDPEHGHMDEWTEMEAFQRARDIARAALGLPALDPAIAYGAGDSEGLNDAKDGKR